MPTPKRGPRFGGSPAHQRAMLANLASDLLRHGRIRTTEAKAKALRPYVEPLITKGKQGDLHARRQVLSKLRDRDVVAYLFDDVAPRFADRQGGYTRILKLAPRRGDNARMAIIELVDQGAQAGEDVIEDAKQGRSRGLFGRRRRRGAESAGTAGSTTLLDGGEDRDEAFDVEDDQAVAAAIAAATGADAPGDEGSPESADAAESADTDDDDDAAGDDTRDA